MTITREPYDREQAVAIEAVRAAARLCQAVAASISPDVLAKKDKSPVTVADFGSQALICRALGEAFPDDPVIAEEDAADLRLAENAPILDRVVEHVAAVCGADGNRSVSTISREQVCSWIDHGGASAYSDRFWTLDPIDGTKGFLRGEQYAVALALVVHGEVVVAALACPNLPAKDGTTSNPGSIFCAAEGRGHSCCRAGATANSIRRPIASS